MVLTPKRQPPIDGKGEAQLKQYESAIDSFIDADFSRTKGFFEWPIPREALTGVVDQLIVMYGAAGWNVSSRRDSTNPVLYFEVKKPQEHDDRDPEHRYD